MILRPVVVHFVCHSETLDFSSSFWLIPRVLDSLLCSHSRNLKEKRSIKNSNLVFLDLKLPVSGFFFFFLKVVYRTRRIGFLIFFLLDHSVFCTSVIDETVLRCLSWYRDRMGDIVGSGLPLGSEMGTVRHSSIEWRHGVPLQCLLSYLLTLN